MPDSPALQPRKRRLAIAAWPSSVFGVLVVLVGVVISMPPASAQLKVATTTADLASVAREIGGPAVDVVALARPGEDPHFVDAKPSFIARLSRVDMLIEGGAELESGWLPALLLGARNPKIALRQPGRIRANIGIEMLEIPTSLDRSQGDLHASGNPHFLIAPSNMRILARRIASGLESLDASNARAFQDRLKSFEGRLDSKLLEWRSRLEPHRGRQILGYHNSWIYFAREFGLKVDFVIEPKPGIPPSARRMADLITAIRENDIRAVFVEPHVSRRFAETLSQKTGIRMVMASQYPGGIPGTEAGVIELLDRLTGDLARALEQPLGK